VIVTGGQDAVSALRSRGLRLRYQCNAQERPRKQIIREKGHNKIFISLLHLRSLAAIQALNSHINATVQEEGNHHERV